MARDYGRISIPPLSYEDWGMRGRNSRSRYNRKVAVWEKTGGYCIYCDCALSFRHFHMDHAKAKWAGGSNLKHNLLPACLSCNNRKWNSDAVFWCKKTGNEAALFRLAALGVK